MRNGKPAVCGRLAGQGDDPRYLLRSERRRCPTPFVVGKDSEYQLLEILIGRAVFLGHR
jgi:hypothetical protein